MDNGLNRVPLEGPPTRITALVVFATPPLGLLVSDGSWRLIFGVVVVVYGYALKVLVRGEEDTESTVRAIVDSRRTASDP